MGMISAGNYLKLSVDVAGDNVETHCESLSRTLGSLSVVHQWCIGGLKPNGHFTHTDKCEGLWDN